MLQPTGTAEQTAAGSQLPVGHQLGQLAPAAGRGWARQESVWKESVWKESAPAAGRAAGAAGSSGGVGVAGARLRT